METIYQIIKKISLIATVLFLFAINSLAQMPTYLCELRNDAQIDSKTVEFDVYLLRTGSTAFEYSSMQMGININTSAANGGTITPTFVAGSDLNASQVFTANKLTYNAAKNWYAGSGSRSRYYNFK